MRRLAALLAPLFAPLFAAAAIAPAPASAGELAAQARRGLDLTIYANGLTVVHDRRAASLTAGANRLAFPDVSPQMIPESAVVSGAGLTVNVIDFDPATLSPGTLLERHLGREVGVVRTDPTTGEESVERATLISIDPGIVLKYRDRIETEVPGRLVFDAIPDDLRRVPALTATVHADGASEGDVALTYLTTGLDWTADYVAVVDEDAGRVDLTGRAVVRNTTGSAFSGASLALVAGEVRRASGQPQPRARSEMVSMAAAPPPSAAPDRLGAAYLYRLPAQTDLADRQARQFTLLEAAALPLEQRFVSESGVQAFIADRSAIGPTHPTVRMRLDNPSAGAGGLPLPAGIVRVYAAGGDRGLMLLGEDLIPDTPQGGTVALETGTAFDITVDRRQTDFSRIDLPDTTFESAWRIEVSNARSRPVLVDVIEALPGDWEIIGESVAHEKTRADQARWTLAVPAQGRMVLEYRVRVRQ